MIKKSGADVKTIFFSETARRPIFFDISRDADDKLDAVVRLFADAAKRVFSPPDANLPTYYFQRSP